MLKLKFASSYSLQLLSQSDQQVYHLGSRRGMPPPSDAHGAPSQTQTFPVPPPPSQGKIIKGTKKVITTCVNILLINSRDQQDKG